MILKGQKVILRPVRLSDAERFVKWFNDPEVNRFMFYRSLTLKAERKIIKDRLSKKTKDTFHFCIDTKDGKHIGVISLENINQRNKNASFGIMIGEKKYWSKGFGSDACNTILNFGFKKLGLHRVELDVYSYNKRAYGLYKKLGFKREGVKREHNFWNGKFWDTYIMSVLETEWKGGEKSGI